MSRDIALYSFQLRWIQLDRPNYTQIYYLWSRTIFNCPLRLLFFPFDVQSNSFHFCISLPFLKEGLNYRIKINLSNLFVYKCKIELQMFIAIFQLFFSSSFVHEEKCQTYLYLPFNYFLKLNYICSDSLLFKLLHLFKFELS